MKLTKPVSITDLNSWLKAKTQVKNQTPLDYRFALLKEDVSNRDKVIPKIKELSQQAFYDWKQKIIEVRHIDLDPLDSDDVKNKKQEFANKLDQLLSIFDDRTLQGYFGEILGGAIILGFSPFDNDEWDIPVFLYRHHIHGYDAFEKWRQGGQLPKAVIGRAGEDNIAFWKDKNGKIIGELRCESKCTTGGSDLVDDAHEKFKDSTYVSPEIFRILEILKDYSSDPIAVEWTKALRDYQWNAGEPKHIICYVCGESPKRPKDRVSWIKSDAPHKTYNSSRPLQVFEIHISNIPDLIDFIFDQKARP